MAQAPTVQFQTASINSPGQQRISFRAATMERIDILAAENNVALTSSLQPIQRTVEGAGYVYGILLDIQATSATSTAATVAVYAEDAPFNVLDTVAFSDANGELLNLGGWELYAANVSTREDNDPFPYSQADGTGKLGSSSTNNIGGVGTTATQDNNLVLNVGAIGTASTGTGAGGNFRFQYRVKVATNRRDLTGILGNQDLARRNSSCAPTLLLAA